MLDEATMRKEGRSAALQEILDLLAEMEMEPLRKSKGPPTESVPSAASESADSAAAPAAPEESSGGLSLEDIEMLQAKLEAMKE